MVFNYSIIHPVGLAKMGLAVCESKLTQFVDLSKAKRAKGNLRQRNFAVYYREKNPTQSDLIIPGAWKDDKN